MECACLKNFQKQILSPKICVEIFMRILKVSKSVLVFSFLKDSGKNSIETYTIMLHA